jgi:hypothetical protein
MGHNIGTASRDRQLEKKVVIRIRKVRSQMTSEKSLYDTLRARERVWERL